MQIFSSTTPLGRWLAARRAGAIGWLEPLSLVGLFGFLLWKTWLCWPEALIDFPRYLYIPWRMSQGALLYRDLICDYGPLPLLVQAGAFRLFGPGLDVIIWLNIAVTAGVLGLLRAIFRRIGSRLSGWLCGVVFVVVFAVPFYSDCILSLYNFIAPYSCQATWGFGGVLLMVYALLRHAGGGRRRWLFVAGLGVGIAFLDKPELLLAALGTLGLYLGLALLRTWRRGRMEGRVKKNLFEFAGWLGWGLGGFLAAYLPVFFFFAREGGWAYGFYSANATLQVFLDADYARATTTYFQDSMMGFDHLWPNLLSHLQWGVVLLVFCSVMGWAGRGWRKAQQAGEGGEGFAGLVLALSFLVMLLTDWLGIGRALLVPLVLIFLVTVGWSVRQAWQGRAGAERRRGLAVVATTAMLLLGRMLLNVRISNYGFFLVVLAALLVVHVLVYELPLRWGREAQPNRLLQIAFTLLVLMGAAQLGRGSLANYEQRTNLVGAGRDHFYSSPPRAGVDVADNNIDGVLLNLSTAVMRKYFSQVKTVVAFPESMAVDYHLRKLDPVPNLQFTPDILQMLGADKMLASLTANPPDAVVLSAREMHEYDKEYFGVDAASGKAILDWVENNYTRVFVYGQTAYSATGHDLDIFIRRDLLAGH